MGDIRNKARVTAATLAAALVAATLAGAASAHASTAHAGTAHAGTVGRTPAQQSARQTTTSRPQHGKAAVEALKQAHRLRATAKDSGLTPSSLKQQLRTDPTMYVAGDGLVEFHEELPPAAAGAAAGSPGAAPAVSDTAARTAVTATTANIPVLHSLPGARQTIFLDFNGATVSGTAWNAFDHLAAGAYPAWRDPSGNIAADVRYIWQRVAADYSPFNIDVTTQDPGTAKLNRSWSADAMYGVHVLITPSAAASKTLCNNQCGGIAALGGMSRSAANGPLENTVFVFPHRLSNVPNSIADAAAHEAGHTWGLTHQGTGKAPVSSPDNSIAGTYYAGNGLWGPIMGDPYTAPVSQWAHGEYPKANNKQNEIAVMAAHGLRLRPDEGAATAAKARPLPGSKKGAITSASDVDWFNLGTCVKGKAIGVNPGSGSDLDAVMTLRTAAGKQTSYNPAVKKVNSGTASGMNATFTPTAKVHYWIGVRSTGYKTATTGGYSRYGSIGTYAISAPGCTPPAAKVPGAPQDVYGTMPLHGGTTAITWAAPAYDGGASLTGYRLSVDGGKARSLGRNTHTAKVNLSARNHTVTVWAVNGRGRGAGASFVVKAPTKPGPVGGMHLTPIASQARVNVGWRAPAAPTIPVTHYQVGVNGHVYTYGNVPFTFYVRGVSAGYVYHFAVRAVNALGAGPWSSQPYVFKTKPGPMYLHKVRPGKRGGKHTVKIKWWPLQKTGDYKLTKYRIYAYKWSGGHITHTYKKKVSARKRKYQMKLPPGRYLIAMKAKNSLGWGALSKRLGVVRSR